MIAEKNTTTDIRNFIFKLYRYILSKKNSSQPVYAFMFNKLTSQKRDYLSLDASKKCKSENLIGREICFYYSVICIG